MYPQTTYHPNKDQDWTRFVRSMSDGISSPDETNDAPYGGAVDARIDDGDDASFAMNTSFLPIVGPVVSENDEERKQREDLDLLAAIFSYQPAPAIIDDEGLRPIDMGEQPLPDITHDAPPKFDTTPGTMVETIVPGCPAPIAVPSYASSYASEFAYERVPDAIALAALLPASPTVCATSPLYRDTTPYSVASETVFARSPSAFVEDGKMVEEMEEDDEDESMGDEASVAGGERERSEDDASPPVMGHGKDKEFDENVTGHSSRKTFHAHPKTGSGVFPKTRLSTEDHDAEEDRMEEEEEEEEDNGIEAETSGSPKICEICGKKLKRDIRRHMKTHTGEKPFMCRKMVECGRRFARSDPRNKHEKTCGLGLKPGRPLGSKGKKRKNTSGRKRRA